MPGAHAPAPDVVQVAAVARSHHRVHSPGRYADLRIAFQHIGGAGVGHEAHIERIGQQDGRLDRTQLARLFETGGLAVAVDGINPRGYLFPEGIAGVGQGGGHARADRAGSRLQSPLPLDEGRVPDQDALHVGDGVQRPWGQLPITFGQSPGAASGVK